jgi:hypothetical protein
MTCIRTCPKCGETTTHLCSLEEAYSRDCTCQKHRVKHSSFVVYEIESNRLLLESESEEVCRNFIAKQTQTRCGLSFPSSSFDRSF